MQLFSRCHAIASRGLLMSVIGGGLFLLGPDPADATTILATSFEAPDFTLGDLGGQNGWFGFGNAAVQNTVASDGTQAVFLPGGISVAAGLLPMSEATDAKTFRITMDMLVDQSAATGTSVVSLAVAGDTGFIGQVAQVASGQYRLGNTDSNTTPIDGFDVGVFNAIEFELDFSTLTMSASVDGIALGSIDINTAVAPTEITFVQVAAVPVDPSAIVPDVYFDNLSFSDAPEPTTLALLGSGIVAAACFRRRRPVHGRQRG